MNANITLCKEKIVFISLISFFLLSINLKGQTTISPEMTKLFFEESDFKNLIYIELPPESSLSQYQYFKNNPDIHETGIPSVRIDTEKKLDEYDQVLLNFLVKNGFAKIETLIQIKHNKSYGDKTYVQHFIFYSDAFKKRIAKDKYGVGYFAAGKRKINSIDYKNVYEDAYMGMNRKFYAITFTYILTSEYPNLAINKSFKGKAKAFQDPDDGTWKMEGDFLNLGLSLEDKGSKEYLSVIASKYPPFDFKKSTNDFYGAKEKALAEERKMQMTIKIQELDSIINFTTDYLETVPEGIISVENVKILRKNFEEIQKGYRELNSFKNIWTQSWIDECNALKERTVSHLYEVKQLVKKYENMETEIPLQLAGIDSLINHLKEKSSKMPDGLISIDSLNLFKQNIVGFENEYLSLVANKDSCQKCTIDKCHELKKQLTSVYDEIVRIESVVVDIEGNRYTTVQIGNQVWMAENLRTTTLNDGKPITLIIENNSWGNRKKPAYCWYNNSPETYKSTYGALYNYHAIRTDNLCPLGWHVPSLEEWIRLVDFLGGKEAGGKLKEVGSVHWKHPNKGATNSSGFTVLPGGRRSGWDGSFFQIGMESEFWSSTQDMEESRKLNDKVGYTLNFNNFNDEIRVAGENSTNGFSVRCVKD